jgi:hypothetical protein
MKTHLQLLKDLDDLIDLQSSNGNWNYNEYMMGLANGMILARHIMRDERGEVPYLTAPNVWLRARATSGQAVQHFPVARAAKKGDKK